MMIRIRFSGVERKSGDREIRVKEKLLAHETWVGPSVSIAEKFAASRDYFMKQFEQTLAEFRPTL